MRLGVGVGEFLQSARGYFGARRGNVTDEVIAKYIEMREKMERARDDDCQLD
jgi:hypothetical protein